MVSGIFNIFKPPGMTSHDVIWRMRKITGIKKIGHAGTLDPDATGVLPVFTGEATRLIEYVSADDKCYRVQVALGIKTSTGDDSGEIIERGEIPSMSLVQIENVFSAFTGEILQVPPMYSAIKHNGKKLYQLAREGKSIERESRRIFVNYINLLYYCENYMILQIDCSKGTYIRTLVEDLAQALGTVATVKFLLRVRSGIFNINDSCFLEELTIEHTKFLLPLDTAIAHITKLILSESQTRQFCHGMKIHFPHNKEGIVRLYSSEGIFLGMGDLVKGLLKPKKVFNNDRAV